ncbi:MAG: TlpA disulfide reductase family protein [Planctomycetota bacterium]|mgnify:CR=1 FL=1
MRLEKVICLVLIIMSSIVLLGRAEETITVNNINLGEFVYGEEITKEDLADHVVAVEYWGVNCSRCRGSMPQMVEFVKKYSTKPFIFIGFHRQNEPKEKVIAHCKSLKVNYPIYQHGDVKGLTFAEKLLPHFALFNHRGELIYKGSSSDEINVIAKKLEEAINNAPDPLIGEGPYKKLKSLAQQICQRKGLGNIMLQLEKKVQSENPEEKEEAEKLMARLGKYSHQLKLKAEGLKDKEPLQYYETCRNLAEQFKGHAIGDDSQKTLDELKNDKVFQDALKADREWQKIEKIKESLKPCQSDKPLEINHCEKCRKKNESVIAQLVSACKGLLKQHSDTPAASKAQDFLGELE